MQNATLWRALLGVEKTVIEDIEFDEDEQVVIAHVRPQKRARDRCGRCRRPSPAYDRGEGRRRWRALDLGTIQGRTRGRRAAGAVSRAWADGGGGALGSARGRTYLCLRRAGRLLATQCSKTAITELMRIAWRTGGAIITRVWADVEAVHDRFADLTRIGIDEISYKRGQRYLTVVVDHDSGRLVWAAPGREKTTLERFFDALGEKRSALITHDADAPTDPSAGSARTVHALGPHMSGRWLVTTQGSTHVWDLDEMTYARHPGRESRAGAFAHDGVPHRVTRVTQWPVVGSRSFVWFDDPDEPTLVEHYRISSTIAEIRSLS